MGSLAQAISCSNVRGVFPVHELFWFCLVQVSTTQFCSFPAFLMARVSDGTNVPIPPAQASSSNFGSPNGSGSDLDGMGTRSGSTTDEELDVLLSKFVHFETQIAKMEQNFSTFTARLCKVETYAASASNKSGSARSWSSLEQVDGSTAAGSHAQDHLMTTGTRDAGLIFPPNPADEHPRSAVVLRFPYEQYHTGITKWINTL